MALLLDLFPRAVLARVQPLPFAVVDGLRGGGPTKMATGENNGVMDTQSSSSGSSFLDTLRELPKTSQTISKLQREQIPN